MNKRFTDYLSTLTPRKRDLAQEAIAQFLQGENDNLKRINTATIVYNLCRDMCLLDVEHFDILLLNNNYKLIKRVNICQGGITEVAANRISESHGVNIRNYSINAL